MSEALSRFFAQGGFMPHGMCYLWQPGVLWLNVVSDALITVAYFSIPFTLLYFVRKRADLQFNWMFVCFAVFIVACGTTHLMEIVVVWLPAYWVTGGVKALTALASVPTAVLLVKLVPQALLLPSPRALEQVNQELRREMADRELAQSAVRRMNEDLEQRVAERTRELETANQKLQRAYEDLRHTQLAVLQQERLRALGQMASGVAHDINNALSPAALYLQSLLERESGLTVEGREQLEIIQRGVEDVSHTVGRMREFSRSRDSQFVPALLQLGRLIAQVVILTRARWHNMAQESGAVIAVETSVPADLPPVLGSDSEVRDALTNLILNAADAMPAGGTLTLRAYPVFDGSGSATGQGSPELPTHVRVDVCDTGVGMDEETRRNCLEPFFTTKGERGTGLGLAMVYGTIQRHSGEIEVVSEPQKGTTVGLIFPAARAAEGTADKPTPPHKPPRRLRILVVDDDLLLLNSLRYTLEAEGHQVVVADGGQAGIDAFIAAQQRGEPFTVVLSDLGMPHVDGRKVARMVKSASPDTPVVLVTGWGQQIQAENDVPSYVDRVLSKPPRLSELREALASLTAA
jgi:signal transduction histidine kinase/ActR/RegA family two-component response regulator